MDFLAVSKRERKLVTHSVASTKGQHKRKRSYIPRRTRRFQLRTAHPEDMHVAEVLDYARTKRQEVTMIRQGVALEYSLQRGDISLLLERYPWVLEAVKAMITPPPAPDGAGQLEAINEKLNRILELGITDAALPPSPIAAAPVLKQMSLSAPSFEEEDADLPTIITRKDTSTDSNANFMRGLQGIQH